MEKWKKTTGPKLQDKNICRDQINDVIKCLSIKQEIHFAEYLGSNEINEICPVYVTLQKKIILPKNSIKTGTRKLVPGRFVFAKT